MAARRAGGRAAALNELAAAIRLGSIHRVVERGPQLCEGVAADRHPSNRREVDGDSVASVPKEPQPFLKWVGGKGQLLEQFAPLFPPAIDRLIEPFVGGGAVFFHLKSRFPAMRAVLCDNNDELINAYEVVRDAPDELMRLLDRHLSRFLRNRKQYYYRMRSQRLPATRVAARAARMIFLNKTCFNGLWRVNGSGRFNVPLGWQPRPSLYNPANLLAASRALADAALTRQDFRVTLRNAQPGDFVYVDPPYVPVSGTARFTSYTKDDFGARDQADLAREFAAAAQRGARLMLSNSDTPLVRELYRDFEIHPISARRSINRNGAKRGAVGEVVVRANLPRVGT